MPPEADREFLRFRETGDPDHLAHVYDATAAALLRVAIHVAPDAQAAEDLVQQTFLTAIEKAASFDAERPVRPWLTGILQHHAANLRRRARIRAVAPPGVGIEPQADDDPVRALAGTEFDRALDDAIDRLPDAYRPVLVLRLRHGMAPAEIAHALRRPPGTVRTQLVRGIERLRAMVPTALGAVLATWGLPTRGLAAVRDAVLSHARDAAAVTATAGGTATLATVLIMKKSLVVLVAVAVVAAVYGLWPAGPDGTPSPAPDRAPTESAPTAAAAESADPGDRARRAVTTADGASDPARRVWRLRGRIEPTPGVPLDDARIRVVRGQPGDRRMEMSRLFDMAATRMPEAIGLHLDVDGPQLAAVPVAADGSFEIDDLNVAHVRLELVHRFYALTEVIPVHVEPGDTEVDIGELPTYCGGHVLGRVLGATVPAGTEVGLIAEPDVLSVLRDPQAFFQHSLRAGGATAPLDGSGRFEFRAVPAAVAVSLAIRTDEVFAEAPPLPLQAGETREVLLVPRPTGRLEVRCSDEAGAALAGILVRVTPDDVTGQFRVLRSASEARSDAGGVARFGGLDAGGYRLIAETPGRCPVRQALAITADATRQVDIVLATGPTVTGRVVDAAGQPIADAGVQLLQSMDVPLFGDVMVETVGQAMSNAAERSPLRTDADGRFEIGGAVDGQRWNVVASAPGYVFGLARDASPDGPPVEIVLEKPGTIRGRAVHADGSPIGAFEVRSLVSMFLAFERPTAVARIPASGDGRFELNEVPPGTSRLRVEAGDAGRATMSIEVIAGETLELGDIAVEAPGTVRGTVLDADGAPVEAATVRVGRGGMMDHPVMAMFHREREVRTDARGRFELRPVEPGVLRLVAEADGHVRGESDRIRLQPAEAVDGVTIRLPRGGSIVGRLLLPPGADPRDWQVLCSQEVQMTTALGQLGTDGRFRFDHIQPGRHQVQALDTRAMERLNTDLVRDLSPGAIPDIGGVIRAAQEMTVQERVEVAAGEVTEIELDATWVEAGGIELTLDVRVGEAPLETAFVEVSQPESGGAERIRIATVANGRLVVGGLEPGLTRLTIRAGLTMSPLGEPLELELPADTARITREWRLAGGRIAGRVLDAETGEPIPGATLRLIPGDAGRAGRDRDPGFALADASGGFAFEGLPAGRYDLHADESLRPSDGEHTGRIDGIRLASGQRIDDLELRAARGAGLRVHVFGPGGEPLAGCRVLAIGANGTPIGSLLGTWTGADGAAWFAGLPAGAVRAVAWPDGLAPGMSAEQTVGPDRAGTVELRCADGTEVELELVDGDGRPLANASVGMQLRDGPWLSLAALGRRVGADGRLAVGALPSGTVRFAVRHPRATFEVERRVGGGRKLTLALAP